MEKDMTMTSECAFNQIAEIISKSYCDKPVRIAKVMNEIFMNKLGKSVKIDKLDELNLRDTLLVGYSPKREIWVIVVYNRITRGCRGYIYNPQDDECDMHDLHDYALSFSGAVLQVYTDKLKFRFFTREQVGTSILKCMLGGYFDMGA